MAIQRWNCDHVSRHGAIRVVPLSKHTMILDPSKVSHGLATVGLIATAKIEATVHTAQAMVNECASRTFCCPLVKNRVVKKLVEIRVHPTETTYRIWPANRAYDRSD